jgi:hypothetical protein
MPAELKPELEKSVISKAEVIAWLKRSLDAVKQAHLEMRPKDLRRKVHIADRDATVDGMYLRIIVHANEHMGQLIAYARMTASSRHGQRNKIYVCPPIRRNDSAVEIIRFPSIRGDGPSCFSPWGLIVVKPNLRSLLLWSW